MALYWFIIGSIIGSFLTLAVTRTLSQQSFVSYRSHCATCFAPLKWWELIPIVSYFLILGRCTHCKVKLPFYLCYFEMTCGLIFLLFPPLSLRQTGWLLLLLILQIIAELDWLTYSFPFLWILFAFFISCFLSDFPFWLIASCVFVYLILTNWNSHRPFIGNGDLDLLLVLLITLGLVWFNAVVLVACVLALIYFLFTHKRLIPFVPFLFSSLLIILLIHTFL